jgi:hypothetical protein
VHIGDPTNNVTVKVTEDLDKMKEYDFLTYMPEVRQDHHHHHQRRRRMVVVVMVMMVMTTDDSH